MSERTIEGHMIELSDGRHVWVGKDEDRFLVQFRSPEGKLTRLVISKEAGDALHYLLGEPTTADQIVKKFIMHMTAAVNKEAQRLEWREVKPDELPITETKE